MFVPEPSVTKPRMSRRSHPKVRSGCLTCKIRRVKCDEQRPSCLRCIKYGINCDGYAPPKETKKPQHPRTILLPLLPKSQNIHIWPTLFEEPSLSRFESEEEFRYFEVFSTNTAYEIFPNVEMGRLRLMFLQACESKDSIRHAIIALGALDMTSQAPRLRGHTHHDAHDNCGSTASHHYQYAIKEYAQALKYAQLDGAKDFRTALITSLVILSFEGWIGNHEVAVQQIRIGTRLLKEWKERYMARISSDEENILAHVFTRLSVQLRSPPPKDRPPQSSVLAPLPPLKIDPPQGLERMPKSFSTLAEAEKFYSAIVRFAVSFVSQGLPRIGRAGSLTGAYSVGATSEIIPPEIVKAQAILTESLNRWMAAFTPLKRNREFKTLDEKKASITLELQMKATYMGTIKSLAQDELVFDAYYEIYKDMVNLSEALLNSSNPSKVPRFSFDSGVIIPLWFTGHKCRDPIIRRRAISLLLKFPRREGVWDSVFAGLVIECLRGFEEEYMEDGKTPGWARIRSTTFDIDFEKRTVEVKCQQRISPTSEEFVTKRKTVDYYVHTGITLEQVGAIIAQ